MKKIIALVSFIIVILIVISCTQHEQDNPYDITGTKGYHPPSVSAIDKDAAINDTITLQATATDSNGNIALMIWKELNGSWIDSSSTPTIQTVFTTPSVKRIIVMAVDNDGLTASDTFNLTIHLYQPSVKLNSSSLSVNAGDSLTFTALGFDTNGTIAMILWDTGAVFGTKDTTLRVGLMTPGSRKIAVRVKDDDSILSEWDSIKIAINSMPPVISSKSPDTTIIVGDTLTARVNASDNGKIVKYLWARDSINYIDSSDAGAFKTSWTTAGAYVIGVKVRDNSGEYSNQSYIHITVKNAYEKTKNLLPINNEAIITLKPLFAWQPGTYHKTYDLFLDTVNPPVTLHKSAITDTFFTPASDLKYSKTYYWFIKAKDGSLNSDSSPVFKFTTTNNSAPKFIKPANMTVSAIVGTQYIDTLHAADSNGHSLTYKVLSDTSIKFSPTTDSILRWSPQIKDTGTKIFQVMVSDGYNGTDTLAWSVTVTINISKPIISIDNTTSSSAILKWSDSQNATNYRLERGAAKTGPFTTVYTGSDTTFTNNALSPQTTYWYRVIGNTGSFLSVWSDTLGATTMAASTAKNHVFWYNSIAKNYAINDSPGPNLPTGTIRHEGMIMSAQYTQFPGQNGERFAVGNSGNKGRCGILWAKDLMEANGTCSKALVRAEYLDKFAGTPYCEPGTIRVKVGVVDFIGNIESYGLPEDVPSNAVWNDVNGNSISWNMTYNLQSGNLTNEQFIDVVIPQGVTSSSQNAILDKKFMEIDVTSQVNWILSHTGTNKGSSSGQYAIVFLTDPSSSSTAQMHTYSYESSTGKETISPWTQDGNSLHLFVNGDLNFTTPTYLSTPVLGTMTPDTTHIQINWPTVTDATNYKVERSTSASGSFIQIYSGSSNSIVDTNLLPDTEYWYRVRALSTNNLSAWSTVASARTAQLLTKPNFTTDPKDTVIDVGKPLTLRSLATGNPIPRYQWYKNGTLLAGDTLRDMTISNLLTSNSGDYYVVASNSEGTKTSATASVKVKGLLVYYPLDGNASDFSGNGYDATPRAATSFQGHLGSGSQALNLYDTSSSKIVLAGKHAQNLNFDTKHDPFTVSVWLYNISAPTKDVPVITDRGPTSSSPYAYRLYYQYPKGLTLEIWDGVNTPVLVEYAFTPTASSWTHIAFTNDTNAITLYVNGNRQTPVTLPTYLGSTKNTDTLITMGQDVISGKSMNGGLDDIRIYNMCLSTGSIDSLYHLGGYSVTTNNAPVFSTDTAAGSFNRTGTVNNTYSVNVVATDIDGDQVNYIVLTPSGATCTASGVFSFTPTTSGDTRVSIIADDSKGGSDTLTWTVTVNNYITWKKTIGTPDAELGMAVQRTLDGGYIITGTHQANSIDDLYLLKTDSNGTEEWSKHFYGPARAFGYSVVATSDGGYIVAGSLKTATGNEDILIIKTDAVGDKIWEKTYGTAGYDEAVHNIKSTNDGGFILVGSAGGDVYVMKLYQNGDSAWTKSFNLGSSPPNYDAGNSIEQTSDGGYIIAAYTTWNVGGNDAYVIKLDQSGNKTWDKVFILADHQELYSIEQTVDGGYIATGYNSTNSGAIYIMKLNNNGDTTWTKSIDGVSTERSYSVKQTSDGGYVIAGETLSEGSGLNDGYIIKTNSDGTVLWARTYGTSNNDYFRDLQLTTDGGFIIVGFADDGTSNNVFLVKTDSVGLVK